MQWRLTNVDSKQKVLTPHAEPIRKPTKEEVRQDKWTRKNKALEINEEE